MYEQTNGSDNGLKTVGVGVAAGVVGAVVGATVAAMSDEKTRNKVIDMAGQAKDKGMEILEAVQDKTEDVQKKGEEIAEVVKK